MRVLVTFAVEAELAPWRKLRGLERLSVDGIDVYKAQIGRAQVHFVVTGMGMENAARVADAVMKQPYQFCISSGFAKLVGLLHYRVRHPCGVLHAHPGHYKMNLRAPDLRLVNVDPVDAQPFQAAQLAPRR